MPSTWLGSYVELAPPYQCCKALSQMLQIGFPPVPPQYNRLNTPTAPAINSDFPPGATPNWFVTNSGSYESPFYKKQYYVNNPVFSMIYIPEFYMKLQVKVLLQIHMYLTIYYGRLQCHFSLAKWLIQHIHIT